MNLSWKEILAEYSTWEKERAMQGILFDLLPNAEQRKAAIRAMRIELTRKTASKTKVEVNTKELRVLAQVIEQKEHAIIDKIANNTCIAQKAEPKKVAIAVVEYVKDLLHNLLKE